MKKVQCLVCDKELDFDDRELVYDGGFMYIEFHYGSRHDQCKGFAGHDSKDPLLDSDEIEAYICDDCFDKKRAAMKGFKTTKKTERTQQFGA